MRYKMTQASIWWDVVSVYFCLVGVVLDFYIFCLVDGLGLFSALVTGLGQFIIFIHIGCVFLSGLDVYCIGLWINKIMCEKGLWKKSIDRKGLILRQW